MTITKENVDFIESGIQGANLNNTQLLNKICEDYDVLKKLGKSSKLHVVELVTDELPRVTFIFNKGFTKGKIMCVICFHNHEEGTWHSEMSEPFFMNEGEWESGKFKSGAREDEFYAFIESGIIWKQ